MTQIAYGDEDIDLALDEPGPVLRAVARIPDRYALAYLLLLAVVSGGAIVWMVAR